MSASDRLRFRLGSTALAAALVAAAGIARAEEEDMSASGFDNMRIEQEEKLFVPLASSAKVWEWLERHYVKTPETLRALDPLFTAYANEEDFTDVYYDTPSLQMLARESGVRHRTRVNLTDPTDRKSGRELMQIKLNGISVNHLERGEIKYPIEHLASVSDRDDSHPMLGIVERSHRKDFVARLEGLGLDPQSMRPVLTVRDLRRRIYIKRDGNPYMSISMDFVRSQLWWAEARFVEIEPELNEIAFTDADAATRRSMEGRLGTIVGQIRAEFPEIVSNLHPKYNKSFAAFEAQIPFVRTLVRFGLHDANGLFLFSAAALAAAALVAWLGVRVARRIGGRPPLAGAATSR